LDQRIGGPGKIGEPRDRCSSVIPIHDEGTVSGRLLVEEIPDEVAADAHMIGPCHRNGVLDVIYDTVERW
jgi:hypothetical protein